ncbi:7570_t:CDS:2, partial [Paraglomus brasilianum]
DKVVSQFEDILFAESDFGLFQKLVKAEDEQTALETNIATLVTALKNDLQTGHGRNFFDLIIKYNELSSKEKNTSTAPPSTEPGFESYGSVIKTGYEGCGRPLTHPIYLRTDLPAQI